MALPPVAPASLQASPAARPVPGDAKIHQVAKQFEAMFMGEMLRLARPTNKAAGVFAEGQAEKSWQILMDQALGQAAAAQDRTGLTTEIEKAMRKAQGPQPKETK